jgi:hypothetical protein
LIGGDDAKAKLQHAQLPTTYLIDRQGRIRQKIIGARDKPGWEAAVKPLLEKAGHARPQVKPEVPAKAQRKPFRNAAALGLGYCGKLDKSSENN